MPQTKILQPLKDEELSQKELAVTNSDNKKVKDLLDAMKYGEDVTFDKFLVTLGMSFDEYILAIRSELKRVTIFLKRNPHCIRVNN